MNHQELIDALSTPIADALRSAGHDELAGIAVDAAREIDRPSPIAAVNTGAWNNVGITLESRPGCHISMAAESLSEIARRLGMRMSIRFNGTTLTCEPGESAESVMGQFDRAIRTV